MSGSGLSSAIITDDKYRVASLIASGGVDVNERVHSDNGRCSPLILAAMRGRRAIAELLLNAGAEIDDVDEYGRSACFVAAERDDTNIVALLVERGAALGSRNNAQRSLLSIAVSNDNASMTVALIRAGAALDDDAQAVCRAAAMGGAVLDELLLRNVDVGSLRLSDGCTPCHVVVDRGNDTALLARLISTCGVDINARNEQGNTCLQMATAINRYQALAWLISAGADLENVNKEARTALFQSCDVDAGQCVYLLLAANANVHALNASLQTPCHAAAIARFDVLGAMLAAGGDLDFRDGYGISPRLHAALCCIDLPSDAEIAVACRRIAVVQLELVRDRALQVCIGLQSRGLDALQMCEILRHACGAVAPLIPFHQWWKIATTIKHFHHQN
jgi:ankyrin repeat protein